MTLYETIFKRRSVRDFKEEPLPEKTLKEIKKFLDRIDQLPGEHAEFKIVDAGEVSDTRAPHYILAYAAPTDTSYVNTGYCLQKADLYLQSTGLGSLWLGMAKPEEEDEDFVIMLGFGSTDLPMRNADDDFNRIGVEEVSNRQNEILRAARLAPSAMNSQPWKINFSSNKIIVSYFGRGLKKLLLKKRLNKIDIGIVTRHIQIALEHEKTPVKKIIPSSDDGKVSVVFEL